MAALGGPEGQQAWDTFTMIGDVLRAEARRRPVARLSERLAARLAAEPLPSKRSAAAEPSATTATAGPR
jgi:sigma-E factor negative regulatory protein RseA